MNRSHTLFSFSNVDFEQVNTGWERLVSYDYGWEESATANAEKKNL